jgi:protein SCO1/2
MLALSTSVRAQSAQDFTKAMAFDQKLGAQVPLDVPFNDDNGNAIKFGDVLQGRPIILVPIFYSCQTGCALVEDSLIKTLAAMTKKSRIAMEHSWNGVVGKDFDVVMVSIDPKETPKLALSKKAFLTNLYNQPGTEGGWHLLTGTYSNILRVTDAVGFHYFYDGKNNIIRHPTGLVFLTPKGVVSSYILGTEYTPSVLDSNVVLAANNQIGRKAETVLFGCIMLDPATGQRRIIIENVVRVSCFATLIAVATYIISMCLKDRRNQSGGGSALLTR